MIGVHEFLPTSRICLIKYKNKEKIKQVFKEGDNCRLLCLNPIYRVLIRKSYKQ